MALSKAAPKGVDNPIPVIGVESNFESFSEGSEDKAIHTAVCAYYKAEARGFEPGHEMDDWLAAESEINQ